MVNVNFDDALPERDQGCVHTCVPVWWPVFVVVTKELILFRTLGFYIFLLPLLGTSG